jgi:hypothetical protein
MTAPLPDIEHRPGEVTFRGEALKTLNGAIDAGIREKRRAGWSIEPYLRAKFAVLAAYRWPCADIKWTKVSVLTDN